MARTAPQGAKEVAGWHQAKFRGKERIELGFTFALAAYNLIRMPKLLLAEGAA